MALFADCFIHSILSSYKNAILSNFYIILTLRNYKLLHRDILWLPLFTGTYFMLGPIPAFLQRYQNVRTRPKMCLPFGYQKPIHLVTSYSRVFAAVILFLPQYLLLIYLLSIYLFVQLSICCSSVSISSLLLINVLL
jgi:hypothetical protein